ncbi:MAG TPA: hypothetical protein PK156_47605 [Polyangium sp.]|nr:hypothetical protein [Polyangium sp.]
MSLQKAIVIAYEDAYCNEFHLLLKKLRRDVGLSDVILEARPVKGTGQFVHEVPKLLRAPLKQTKRPPDRLVCVADVDKPTNLVPHAVQAPRTADLAMIHHWVGEFEGQWRDHLQEKCQLPEESLARLKCVGLRWSKESLLIASAEGLRAYAAAYERTNEVEQVLNGCEPALSSITDAEFIMHYRDPLGCMGKLMRSVHGRDYKKGTHDEDLLRDYIAPDARRRGQLLARCPDLERLLALLHFPEPD